MQEDLDLNATEQQFRATLAEEAPELAVADEASELIASVLAHGPAASRSEMDDAQTARIDALGEIAVRMFRTIRAGIAVLASGYELEARAIDRLILELDASCSEVLADATGVVARAWLKGKRDRGWGARIRKATPALADLYGKLSEQTHGMPAGFHAMSGDDVWGPRRTDATRTALLFYAVAARNMALHLAREGRLPLARHWLDRNGCAPAAWDG